LPYSKAPFSLRCAPNLLPIEMGHARARGCVGPLQSTDEGSELMAGQQRWSWLSRARGEPRRREFRRAPELESHARFEGLLQAAPDAMVGVYQDGTIAFVNDRVEELFGYTRGELLGRSIEILVPERSRSIHTGHRQKYCTSPQSRPIAARLDLSGRRKDGTEFAAEISLSSTRTDQDLLVVAAVRDVTERRRVEADLAARVQELDAIAATDGLTGLANRRELERVLGAPCASRFAVLAIDVDNLKAINDAYGHEAGDACLLAIGETLRMGAREGETVARSGGDEFVVFMLGISQAEAAEAAHRLCQTMHGVAVPHGSARISIGCAVGSAGDDRFDVWAAADDALSRAKQLGRDRVEVAPEGVTTTYATSLARWEPILPSLILDRRVVSAFQPIVDLHTGTTHGYEALARVAGGPVDASVEGLFATAQRLGVHRDLDWACRRAAVQDAHKLQSDSLIFINVGVSALLDPLHDVDQMLMLLRWAGRSPRRTVLEITEREAVRDLSRLREVVDTYRRHGFRFALDDVGEGHSTFEVLATATPEFIKVSSKLTRWSHHLGPQAVIRSLLTFTEATATQLIAEGVETRADAERMRHLGVPLGQGFALGRPGLPRRRSDEARLVVVHGLDQGG
jgi:diguanylate cyclase (GGDEF)-like protein/PAS domain S-box-containing protein